MLASLYSKIEIEEIMTVRAPYIPPNLPAGVRCRGNLRDKISQRDIVFTGPRMKVVYSGCQWNTIVFAMDDNTKDFETWVERGYKRLQDIIKADPAKFKCTRRIPLFSKSLITESSDPLMYPNQLRCRLAVKGDKDGNKIVTSVLLQDSDPTTPARIWGGGWMIPIFSMGYYKDGDEFGLSLTLLKGEYTPPAYTPIMASDWIPDTDSNATGSASSSSSSPSASGFADGFLVGN